MSSGVTPQGDNVPHRTMLSLLVWTRGTAQRLYADSLIRNSFYIIVTSISTAGLGYVYWVIAARTYADFDVGFASAIISAMTFVALLTNLGFASTLIEQLPRSRNSREWSRTFNIAIATVTLVSIVGALVALGIFRFLPDFSNVEHGALYSVAFVVCVVASSVALLVDGVFNAERASHNMLIRNTIFSLLKVVFLVVLVPLGLGSLSIFVSWLLGVAISLLVSIVQLRRIQPKYVLVFDNARAYIRETVRSMIGNHLITIGGASTGYLLPVLVTVLLSPQDNAYFYATWMFCTVFFMISPAVATSLFAHGVYDRRQLKQKTLSGSGSIALILIPTMIAVFLFGEPLLGIFGAEYAERGLPMLRLLVVSAIPDAVVNVAISLYRIEGRLAEATLLNVGTALIALVIAALLLPSGGIIATGWAWLIAQSLGTLYVVLRPPRLFAPSVAADLRAK